MSATPQRLPGEGVVADEVELGLVQGVFGVRGEVRLFLYNPTSDLLRQPRAVVLVGADGVRYGARLSARPGAGKRILGRIEGITDPDAAAALNGARVVIPRAALPPVGPDEWYVADLIGCDVFVGERRVGVVAEVHHGNDYDMLEVDTGAREREFVVLRKETVREVDVAHKRVVVAEAAW